MKVGDRVEWKVKYGGARITQRGIIQNLYKINTFSVADIRCMDTGKIYQCVLALLLTVLPEEEINLDLDILELL